MKATIHYLTTEFHNCGTETELFGSQEALEDRFEEIIRERIADIRERYTAGESILETCEKALAALDNVAGRDIETAWELFRDGDEHGPLQHYDDCFWWGEQVVRLDVAATQEAR